MFQVGDKVEIVDDNYLIGISRLSKQYKNGDVCEVIEANYMFISIQLVKHPPYRKIPSILLFPKEYKAIRKI